VTALRRLPRWLTASLESARERLDALDAAGRRRLVAAAVVFVAGFAIAALLVASGPSTAGESRRDSFLARLVPAPEQFGRRASPEATRAARGMSTRDKVDQLMLLGFEGTGAAGIAELADRGEPGGVAVADENYVGKRQLDRLIERARARARRDDRVPPMFMVSQEGGELSALADLRPRFAPADTASVEEGAKEALASARQLRAIGFDGVLGPVLDVGPPEGGPLGVRVFSDDAREVARYARATVSAYVGERLLSAPLHFPGLGNAATSTDEGPAQVGQTIDALRRTDLLPFRVAFDAGAQAVVVGHGLYGTDDFAVPGSQSRFLLNDLLRQELGFEGLAITDDLAAGTITISQGSSEAAVASIAAGADMVRLSGPPEEQERTRAALVAAVRSGRISRARLDGAVMRVLEAKRAAGVLPRVRREREERREERRRAGGPGAGRGPDATRREGRPPTPRAGGAPAPAPARPRREPRLPGIDRREGRPPGPGGDWPPAPRPERIPGIDRREGRPPGPGGVRQRSPRPRRPTGGVQGQPGGSVPGAGGTRVVPDGAGGPYAPAAPETRTYTVPIP